MSADWRLPLRAAAIAVAAVAALGVAAVGAPAAQAHDQLVSSSPAADEVLTAAPERVDLVYTEEVVALGVIVEVTDFSGDEWVDGEAQVDGTAVSVPLRSGMPEGAYELRWRVVSSDGHPIEGASAFTITHLDASASPTPSPDASSEPPATVDESSAPSSEAPAPNSGVTSLGLLPTIVIALGVIVAVLLVGSLVRVILRRRADGDGSA